MKLLGLDAYHADAAAAPVVDGEVVAAAEEERFRRAKYWAGLPSRAAGAHRPPPGPDLLDSRDMFEEAVFALLRRYLRALLHFLYRYFVRPGFRDGREGLDVYVLLAGWYRFECARRTEREAERAEGFIGSIYG